MKNLFASVIRKGDYDLGAMLRRIDEYHIEGKLTDDDRQDLIAMARGDAAPQLDVPAEIQKLWAAVHALQEKSGSTDESDIPEFVQPTGAHNAYFTGDSILFEGTVYTCIAPEGVACVWSPVTMPDYWLAS